MEHEVWLDGEHHPGDQDHAEQGLPPADPDPEHQLGENDGPEGLREDQGERVAQRHEGQAGELKEDAST